ncbi:PGC-1 and ERR-induced regulator in muscle protein 1 [Poecile atricapillus]|uniref:PGC-1 and ERR-induced regulator in muscle protein 1 n=1 Tax=Poecile atricapillus TaxID=48891 RepID=UPI0027383115|nr:PGC-1 and ERR-induced regulator in muscle protein 1 [Poecile atricapillus]XP_058711211.1 PGC-1 and ERR-induced regulator in muscle protein 1 [Poecile atricapillus]XP_058711212.1 PGC-1 and ERR-induced regulator in muscle protein 1 [Poecile atricapillus]XP_058711213.1 PGC-1 and ERR-induced regulator in muscle protein 1 [Poecile atricapillus]XP_058711214.1 PGC-1 and ERR-induced regulator in muscle protein 1 [Poecile atricapillus]
MDNFEYSIQLNDREWAEFFQASEECSLAPASLATAEEQCLSDIEQGEASGRDGEVASRAGSEPGPGRASAAPRGAGTAPRLCPERGHRSEPEPLPDSGGEAGPGCAGAIPGARAEAGCPAGAAMPSAQRRQPPPGPSAPGGPGQGAAPGSRAPEPEQGGDAAAGRAPLAQPAVLAQPEAPAACASAEGSAEKSAVPSEPGLRGPAGDPPSPALGTVPGAGTEPSSPGGSPSVVRPKVPAQPKKSRRQRGATEGDRDPAAAAAPGATGAGKAPPGSPMSPRKGKGKDKAAKGALVRLGSEEAAENKRPVPGVDGGDAGAAPPKQKGKEPGPQSPGKAKATKHPKAGQAGGLGVRDSVPVVPGDGAAAPPAEACQEMPGKPLQPGSAAAFGGNAAEGAGVKPAAEIPAVPAAEIPAVPAAEIPAIPAAEIPAIPAAAIPAVPAAEIPRKPSEIPAVPAAAIPAVPAAEIPRKPSEIPAVPAAEIPRKPSEIPAVPAAEIPRKPSEIPAVPAAEIPRKSAAEIPRKPSEIPEVPAAGIPREPVAMIPRKPVAEIPWEPAVGIPRIPAAGMPRIPTVGIPWEPATGIPRSPSVEIPRIPAAEIPRIPAIEISCEPAAGIPSIPAAGISWGAAAEIPRGTSPLCFADGASAKPSSLDVTWPEMYEYLFCDSQEEEEELGSSVEGRKSPLQREISWPELYEYFFNEPEGSRKKGKAKDRKRKKPSGLNRPGLQKEAPSSAPGEDSVVIPVPDVYEHCFPERAHNRMGWRGIFSVAPASEVRKAVGALRSLLQRQIQLGGGQAQTSQALVPRRCGEKLALVPLGGAQVWPEDADKALALRGAAEDPRVLSHKDMCLVFCAFASWAVKTSDLQAPDAWKTMFLASFGTLSAIRYFRRQVREGHPRT